MRYVCKYPHVSIHVPARGTTLRVFHRGSLLSQFQSTFPHGERHNGDDDRRENTLFQSTFPHGERQNTAYLCSRSNEFQSTFPHGERLPLCAAGAVSERFQSTFPHGERLRTPWEICGRWRFNPRSRTGNDCCPCWLSLLLSAFQSTFPHGERPEHSSGALTLLTVSIHVPARGTTTSAPRCIRWLCSFNPRSRTGNDEVHRADIQCQKGFQSTFPHGERPKWRFNTWLETRFQSTFPHGERQLKSTQAQLKDVFQSTFPHGERPSWQTFSKICKGVSIHVPDRKSVV